MNKEQFIQELKEWNIKSDIETPFEEMFESVERSYLDYKKETGDTSLDYIFDDYMRPAQVRDYLISLLKRKPDALGVYDDPAVIMDDIFQVREILLGISNFPDIYVKSRRGYLYSISEDSLIELRDSLLKELEKNDDRNEKV